MTMRALLLAANPAADAAASRVAVTRTGVAARRLAVASTLLAAALYTLAFPPYDWAPAAWLVPGLLLVPASRLSPRGAFACGVLFAVTMSVGVANWVAHATLAYFGSNPLWAGLFALGVYLIYGGIPYALLTGAYAVAAARLPRAARAPLAAWLWVASELLRTNIFTGLPWALLGHSQVGQLPLIQVADLGGVYAVSFVITLCSVAVAEGVLSAECRSRPRAALRQGALPAALLAATMLYGIDRLGAYAEPQSAATARRVAVVQGNVPNAFRWKREYLERAVATYAGMTRALAAQRPDLVVWPENAVSFFLNREPALRFAVAAAARSTSGALLLGAPRLDGAERAFNSAYLFAPDGQLVGTYDKRRLVPFAEYDPLPGFGRSAATEPVVYTAGASAQPLAAGGLHLGTVICYEVLFPHLVRDLVRNGADLLINLSNDSWLDRGDGVAPRQHFAMSVFRAVETRRYLVRASASGVSGVVSPLGAVVAMLPSDQAGTVVATVHPRTELSPYVRWGDAWIAVGILVTGCSLWRARRAGAA